MTEESLTTKAVPCPPVSMSTEDSSCKVELEKSFDTQPESPISDPPLPEVPSTLEAPEGGPLAWLQVLASFFILVNTW
ncbi:hypothetical protein FA95DRAFT_1553867 [Auriscalpium vulgare]|uniref:Uncharacterized protein n=1 Tax=Auriscalpium vulgare TaxID=40419 RepID=A0ACB8S6Q3_9AGAM|nr:hypothetical protein FA95DRAFT_1553867 [Auriscalpium vulgare]